MSNFILNLLPGLIIAVVASYLTVRLSIKRFRSERWWERKAEAYSSIVEALHHMKNYFEKEIEVVEMNKHLSEEKTKDLLKKLSRGEAEIAKAIDIGVFFICDDAVMQLKNLRKRLESAKAEETQFEYLDAHYSAINACLNTFSKIAKEDLCVK